MSVKSYQYLFQSNCKSLIFKDLGELSFEYKQINFAKFQTGIYFSNLALSFNHDSFRKLKIL